MIYCDYLGAKQALLATALVLCPTDKEHRAFSAYVSSLENDSTLSSRDVILLMLATLSDGVAHDDWIAYGDWAE